MIALAESVSHGCNTLRYISGETRNKKNPERVYHIYNNLMEQGLDARGIWDSFKLTLARHGKLNGRLKNSVISFVLSPPPYKVKYFSDAQWKQLGLHARLKALQQADAKRAADELKAKRDELTTSRSKAESKPDAPAQERCTNPIATLQQERNDSAARVRKPSTNLAARAQRLRGKSAKSIKT